MKKSIYFLLCFFTILLFGIHDTYAADNQIVITGKLTSENCMGKKVSSVKKRFKNAGFSNIQLQKEYTESENLDGLVFALSIDGKTSYSKGQKFKIDVPVIISYWRTKKPTPAPALFEDGKNAYASGQYGYITDADLLKFAPNMNGIPIYIVTKADSLSDTRLTAYLNDGSSSTYFNFASHTDNYESSIAKGETVAVLGTVGEIKEQFLLGNTLTIDNCYIFAKGEEAEAYRLGQSDPYYYQFFYISEAVANNSDLTEGEYKSICSYLPYEDILRNPDYYTKKYTVVSGEVDQIIEDFFGGITIYILDGQNNKWTCSYSYKDGEPHLLEGDYTNVYGICDGTRNSSTLLGKQVTMPYIKLKYIR